MVKSHRQHAVCAFTQWRWQAQSHALQVAGDADLGRAFAKTQRSRVGRRPVGVSPQPGHQAQLFGLAQAFSREVALRTDHHAGIGKLQHRRRRPPRALRCRAHTALEPHIAAQHARLSAGNRKSALAEIHHAFESRELRRLRRELHIVAGQSH